MCFDMEQLQQVIDGEYEGDLEALHHHLSQCPTCNKHYQRLQEQQLFVEEKLNVNMKMPSVRPIDFNYQIQRRKQIQKGVFVMNKNIKRWGAAAAVFTVVASTLAFQPLRAQAASLLKLFRVSKVEAIAFNPNDLQNIEELMRKKGNGKLNLDNFISVSTNMKENTTNIKEKDIKQFAIKHPEYMILKERNHLTYNFMEYIPKGSITFNLHVDKINDLLRLAGEKALLPKSINRKDFSIHTGNILTYHLNFLEGSMRVTQFDTPTLSVPEGTDEKQLIKILLSLQILPETVKTQLQSIEDLTSTLPIPYDTKFQTKQELMIQDQKAIVLTNKTEKNNHQICYKQNNHIVIIDAWNITLDELIKMLNQN